MAGLVSTIVTSIAQKASEFAASNPASSTPEPAATAEQIKKFNEIAQVATQGLRDLGTWTQKTIPPVFGLGEAPKRSHYIDIAKIGLELEVEFNKGAHQIAIQDPFSEDSWAARFNFLVSPFLWLNVYTNPDAKISSSISVRGDQPLAQEISTVVHAENIALDSSLKLLKSYPDSVSLINGALFFITTPQVWDKPSTTHQISIGLSHLLDDLMPESDLNSALKKLRENPQLTLNQALHQLIDYAYQAVLSTPSSTQVSIVDLSSENGPTGIDLLLNLLKRGRINANIELNDAIIVDGDWIDLNQGSKLEASVQLQPDGQIELALQPNLIIQSFGWGNFILKGSVQSVPVVDEPGKSVFSGISLRFPQDLSALSINTSLQLDLEIQLPSGDYKIKGGFRYNGEISLKDGFELQAGTNDLQLAKFEIQQKKENQYQPLLRDFNFSLSDVDPAMQIAGLKIGNPAFEWEAQGIWPKPETLFTSEGHLALPIKDKSSFAGLKEFVRGASVFYTLASFANGHLSTIPGSEKANATYFYDVNAFSIDRVFDDLNVEINIPRLDYKVPQLKNKTLSLDNLMFGFSSEGVAGRDHQLSFGFEKLSLNSRTQLENLELIFEVYEQNPWGKERTFDTQALTLRADCPKLRDCYDFEMTEGGVVMVSSKEDFKKFVMSGHAFSFKSKKPRVGANFKLKNLIWLRDLTKGIYISSLDIESLKINYAARAIPFILFGDKAGSFEWKDKEIELDREKLGIAVQALSEALIQSVEAHEVGRKK